MEANVTFIREMGYLAAGLEDRARILDRADEMWIHHRDAPKEE